jgi:hypothetical protein
MEFSMTGQDTGKGDLLIQVTSWAGLTVHSQAMRVIGYVYVSLGH